MEHLKGIIRARRAASTTLLAALTRCDALSQEISESRLATSWLREIEASAEIYPFGWYQPPPHGMSVLIGTAPSYARLEYESLRDVVNWPAPDVLFSEEAVLYPYFSSIDRRTGMIGDFVGTFYRGHNLAIREWIKEAYDTSIQISAFACVGRRLCEVYDFADEVMRAKGSRNNTLSVTSGTGPGADIGHTIPGFRGDLGDLSRTSQTDFSRLISKNRQFVTAENSYQIDSGTAFTIEPQMLLQGLPMASFHVIVAFDGADRVVIQEFDPIFEYFSMDWIAGFR